MKIPRRVRILPLLVLVSFLSFTVRIGEFWSAIHAGEAQAQEKVQAMPPPLPPEAKKPGEAAQEHAPAADEKSAHTKTEKAEAAKPDEKKGEKGHSEGPTLPPAGTGQKISWRDATEEQFACTDAQERLNQDLGKRREELEKRDRELATRQALLDAAQQELNQKVTEMTNLRNEIQGMMGQLAAEEKARIESLVKIYEGMKPADAARIFNTLDMDVLMQVVSNMSERKSAPVIALMESDRAKAVTVKLAQQKKMPEMPPDPTPSTGGGTQ